ncbi:MAG: cytidylate kinase-like family protein [Oscillospiraceae bacterium]|nr:cytidylate kinase-like family protein [Oscillospiraceae bacterium]
MANYVVTVAREYGSGGKTIAKMLSERLGIPYYDKDLLRLASEESGINERFFHQVDEKVKGLVFRRGGAYKGKVIPPDSADFVSDDNLFNFQAKIIRELAEKGPCVIVGRCADYILKDAPHVLKAFVYADKATSLQNVRELYGISEREAERLIEKTNKARKEYYRHYTGREWESAKSYDLCLNTSRLDFAKCVDIIEAYINALAD